MSYRSADIQCKECGYLEELFVKFDETKTTGADAIADRMLSLPNCPNCDCDTWEKVFAAPNVGFGSDSKPEQHQKLLQSQKERFVKKELNDLRHKHGRAIDDALRGAAISRIKKGEA